MTIRRHRFKFDNELGLRLDRFLTERFTEISGAEHLTRSQIVSLIHRGDVKVDGKVVDHFTCFETFISIPVTTGKHEIVFSFEPKRIKSLTMINIGLFLAVLLILLSRSFSRRELFR